MHQKNTYPLQNAHSINLSANNFAGTSAADLYRSVWKYKSSHNPSNKIASRYNTNSTPVLP